jgi:hypothetical protein
MVRCRKEEVCFTPAHHGSPIHKESPTIVDSMSQWIMFSLAAFDLQISTQPNFFSQRAAYEIEASSWHCKLFLILTTKAFI